MCWPGCHHPVVEPRCLTIFAPCSLRRPPFFSSTARTLLYNGRVGTSGCVCDAVFGRLASQDIRLLCFLTLTSLRRSAVGITVLFYDHTLTFADEVAFIWTAPASFSKYTCLMNRYLVLGTLIALSLGE